MSTKIDKALNVLNGSNGVGVVGLAFALLGPVTEQIELLEDELSAIKTEYARLCDVNSSYMRGRAADKEDESGTAADVVSRYVILAEHQELGPADRIRIDTKRDQVLAFKTEAAMYREASAIVCDYPGAAID